MYLCDDHAPCTMQCTMQCCICLEDLGNPCDTETPSKVYTQYSCCGRPAHRKCTAEAARHRSTCPWCRAPLPESDEEHLRSLRAGARANRGWAFYSLAEHHRGQTSIGSDRLALALHERAIIHLRKDEWSQKLALNSKYIIAVILYNQNRSRTLPEPVRKRIRKLLTEAAAGGQQEAKIVLETMVF